MFSLLGYGIYTVWWLLFLAGIVTVEVGGVSGKTDAGVAVIAIITAQAFRVELLQKAVEGNPKVAGDRDSIYATVMRLAQAAIYRGALPRTPATTSDRIFVANGLVAAYDLQTLTRHFNTWVANLNDASAREALKQSAKDTLGDATQDDYSKRSNIATLLLKADPAQGRELAVKRSTSIVDQGAF